jgi:DNA-binding LacI/PurR family transcriptional regulator
VRVYVGKGNAPGARPERPNCPEFNADVDANLVAGIAAVATVPHPRWLKPLAKRGIPIVGDGHHEIAVNVGYAGMTHQAIDRLVALGRKRIAVLGGGGSNANDGMVTAARNALHRHGIIRRDGWIRFRPWHEILGAGGKEMRALWAEKEKPDGLFVTDDMLFLDVQTAITQLGIDVPRKLWVIAHGNLGSLRPPPFPCERLVFDPDAIAEGMAERLLPTAMSARCVRRPSPASGWSSTPTRSPKGWPSACCACCAASRSSRSTWRSPRSGTRPRSSRRWSARR